jgi:PAS domain S-box-containing protein
MSDSGSSTPVEEVSFHRALVESLLEGIARIDGTGRFVYANPRFAQLLGLGAPELRERSLEDFLVSSGNGGDGSVKQLLRLAARDGRHVREVRVRRRDGAVVPLRLACSSSDGAEGAVLWAEPSETAPEDPLAGAASADEPAVDYRQVFEAVARPLFLLDEAGLCLEANPAAAAFFTREREEIVGRALESLVAHRPGSGERAVLGEQIRSAVEIGGTVHLSVGHGGRGRTLQLEITPVHWRGGSAAVATGVDTTDARQTERELRESRKDLATTLHSIGEAVLTTDRQGRLTRVNPRAERLLGLPYRGALGRTLEDLVQLINEKTGLQVPDPVLRALVEGRVIDIGDRVTLIAADASRHAITGTAAPIRDRERAVTGVVLAFRDMNTEREAEDQIRRLNALLRATRSVNRLITRESREDRLVQGVCDNLVQAREFSFAWICRLEEKGGLRGIVEAGGSGNTDEFRSKVEVHGLPACVRRAQGSSGVVTIRDTQTECGVCPFSNASSDCSVLLSRLEAGRRIYGVLGVGVPRASAADPEECFLFEELAGDLGAALRRIETERENARSQQALIRAERMSAIGMLAGGIAHEFNNLHAPIMGFIEMILREDNLPPKMRQRLEVVGRAARRATDITRQLLGFSRRGREGRRAGRVNDILRETVEMVRRECENDGIEVALDLGETPPAMMDAGQIGQVVLNLLVNARHAMEERPERRLTVSTGAEGDWVVFRVADTGCGIPPELQERIFDPFFSTKSEQPGAGGAQQNLRGTGLGLSVCETIIKEHGGEIRVESAPERGSVFVVRLPRAESEAVERPAETATPVIGHAGARILVIDDEPVLQELLGDMLTSAGYAVTVAGGGEEGCRRLAEEAFDLVVVDLQMPSVPGEAVIERVAAMPEGRRPSVLAMTGHPGRTDLPALQERVAGLLRKPFSGGKVIASIEGALALREQARG